MAAARLAWHPRCTTAAPEILPDKGKPTARWGRKATGQAVGLIAGLPKEGAGTGSLTKETRHGHVVDQRSRRNDRTGTRAVRMRNGGVLGSGPPALAVGRYALRLRPEQQREPQSLRVARRRRHPRGGAP